MDDCGSKYEIQLQGWYSKISLHVTLTRIDFKNCDVLWPHGSRKMLHAKSSGPLFLRA